MIGQQRTYGRRILLASIRQNSPIARIDLSQNTGISRATVTTVTAELIRAGLIEEVPAQGGEMARGRPRVDLKIRGAAHLVAGIKVAHRSLSLVLMDFEGNQLAEHSHKMEQSTFSSAAMVQLLATTLQVMLDPLGKTLADLSGVGIGIAGIVDVMQGLVHWSPSLKDRNVNLRSEIETALGVPAFVDNDANLVAMAEKRFGLGREATDFIVVTIESGVGMGIVINNEIYRGTRGCGAEFGHTKVQLDGALCRCGQRGCLEAYVADYALLREASVTSAGAEHSDAATDERRIEALLQRAHDGDPLASNIVNRAGRMFAMGLANIVNIFDPQIIVLAGERMHSNHLYAEEVIAGIQNSIVQVDQPPPEVVIHRWGDLMWAKGAAAYALEGVEDMAVAALRANET